MPTDSRSGRVFSYENLRELAGITASQLCSADLNGLKLGWDSRCGAKMMRREGIAQAVMDNSAFRNDSVHPDFTEIQRAEETEEVAFLRSAEEIQLEYKPFRKLRGSVE